MKAKIIRRPLVLVFLISAFITLAGSCSFIFASYFSDELMYADANVNLFTLVPELQGKNHYEVSIRRLDSPLLDSLAIFVRADLVEARVLLLNPETLSLIDTITQAEAVAGGGQLFKQLSVNQTGSYLLGNALYDPLSKSVTGTAAVPVPVSEISFFISPIMGIGPFHFIFFGSPGTGVQYYSSPTYNLANIVINSVVSPTLLGSTMKDNKLLFLIKLGDGSIGYINVDPANVLPAVDFNSISMSNISIDSDNPQIWLTPYGPIARPNKSQLITRYDFATGKAIDSINLDDKNKFIYFENDGCFFYVIDRVSGLLIKSKTWWKK